MIIKDKFRLVGETSNVLDLSESIIKANQVEENSPRHIFVSLELRKGTINHFTKNKIFDLVTNIKQRELIKAVNLDLYPLAVSYNKKTSDLIINLKSFDVKKITSMSVNDLYAALVYAYSFSNLVTKKFKISEDYSRSIVNYFLSLFVQMFGKEYGLVGIYSTAIPKLKFLLTCYILSSFFGNKNNSSLFMKAASISPYMYSNEIDQLKKYDFFLIEDFIKSLSELKVMPGLTITKLTSKLYRFLGINFLPALEDCSRFFSIMLTSSISGSKIIPRYIVKYNKTEYFNIVNITRGMFR